MRVIKRITNLDYAPDHVGVHQESGGALNCRAAGPDVEGETY